MKKFELDLTKWNVTVQRVVDDGKERKILSDEIAYPFRDNLNVWLRTAGIFRSANDIAEAITLAKAIRKCEADAYTLDNREADILRQALDKFIELTADGKAAVGGELHEEAILRVVNMKEIED